MERQVVAGAPSQPTVSNNSQVYISSPDHVLNPVMTSCYHTLGSIIEISNRFFFRMELEGHPSQTSSSNQTLVIVPEALSSSLTFDPSSCSLWLPNPPASFHRRGHLPSPHHRRPPIYRGRSLRGRPTGTASAITGQPE